METIDISSKSQLVRELSELGYKLDEKLCFNYVNSHNGKPYKARSLYIVEDDTGISFAHYCKARRDENFKKLQYLRGNKRVVIKGRVYEL